MTAQQPVSLADRGLVVSRIGLGCNNFGWQIDSERSDEVIRTALDEGITFFDTADLYGAGRSEEILGRAFQGRREQVVIGTKFGKPLGGADRGSSARYIRTAVERSLKRLRTDYIDLYQQYEPDLVVPLDETLEALDHLVQAGKVRFTGTSNASVDHLRQGASDPRASAFVTVQNEYSLLHRSAEFGLLEETRRLGAGFIPYCPLAAGLLTGKYNRDSPETGRLLREPRFGESLLTEQNLRTARELERYALARGRTLVELSLSWLAQRPAVLTVITGATSPEQIRENVRAAQWRLEDADLRTIDEIAPARETPQTLPLTNGDNR